MEKIEVAKKNFEEFINDVGIDEIESMKFGLLLSVSTLAAIIGTMVKDEYKDEIDKTILDFERAAEHAGVARFICQMLENEGESNE